MITLVVVLLWLAVEMERISLHLLTDLPPCERCGDPLTQHQPWTLLRCTF